MMRPDTKVANQPIVKIGKVENFIADKGYDSEAIRKQSGTSGINSVTPRKSTSTEPNPEFKSYLYKHSHFVENLFARPKHYRSIATRFEELSRNFKIWPTWSSHSSG